MTLTRGRMTALFLRVGNLTFGGGDPTMSALYAELVTNRRWMSNETYGLIYALARITPGTNMLAFCAAAGPCRGSCRAAVRRYQPARNDTGAARGAGGRGGGRGN